MSSDNGAAAAITALFTIAVVLLNIGVQLIQSGQVNTGILVIIFGLVLIFAAVAVTKLLIRKIVSYTLSKELKKNI